MRTGLMSNKKTKAAKKSTRSALGELNRLLRSKKYRILMSQVKGSKRSGIPA